MTYTSDASCLRIPDDKLSPVGIALKNSIGMLHVVAESRDFKIFKPVVRFDPVLVVDSHLGGDSDKGISHESMGIFGIQLPIPTKNDAFVSILLVDIPNHDALFMTLVSGQSLESAHITNLIEGESFNRLPLFHIDNLTMGYGQCES